MKDEPMLDREHKVRVVLTYHRRPSSVGMRGKCQEDKRRTVIADVSHLGERASDKFSEMAETLNSRSRDWIPALRNHQTIYTWMSHPRAQPSCYAHERLRLKSALDDEGRCSAVTEEKCQVWSLRSSRCPCRACLVPADKAPPVKNPAAIFSRRVIRRDSGICFFHDLPFRASAFVLESHCLHL